MKERTLFLIMVAAVVGFGCGSGGPKRAEDALKDKGVLDVLKDAANDSYDPPTDGKLTDSQMQMYLKVKERERDLLKVAKEKFQQQAEKAEAAQKQGSSLSSALEGLKTLKTAGDLATLDIRAAQELKYNTAEYQWVKGQVIAAAASSYVAKIKEAGTQAAEASLENLKKARDKATDHNTRKLYDQQIQSMEEMIASSKKNEDGDDQEAIRHNRELIGSYEDQIKLIENEVEKYRALDRR